MIGNQGIDADVAARMDAYRGNPQALMQKYQQNQQLIDLLALQKLKSEKEAAAREMQMQMAQQQQAQGGLPTIAQQREQEVMQMTKDELAKQTGATLGQKQQQTQKNMQGIMQAAGRPGAAPAGRPMPNPAQRGIASAPSAGMTRMAGGGIVAFADGGLNEMDEETRKRVEAGMNRYQGGGAQQYLKSAKKLQDQADQLQDIAPERAANMRAQAEGLIKMAMQLPEMKQLEQAAPAARVRGLMAEAENEPMIPGTSIFGSSPEEAAGLQAEAKDLFAGMQASPGMGAQEEVAKLQEERPGLFGAAPPAPPAPPAPMTDEQMAMQEEDMQAESDMLQAPTAPQPGVAPAEQGLRGLMEEKLRSRMEGPDKDAQARQELYRFLSGMGNKTSLTAGLRGGAQALRGYQEQLKSDETAAIKDVQDLLGMESKEDIAKLERDTYLAVNKAKDKTDKQKLVADLHANRLKRIQDRYKSVLDNARMFALGPDADQQAKDSLTAIEAMVAKEAQNAERQYEAEMKAVEDGLPLSMAIKAGNLNEWGDPAIKTK
jgi:predicted GIY-YIG superfamily endonuclease